eukprot:665649-Prorocentrum_minimum.AAC.2
MPCGEPITRGEKRICLAVSQSHGTRKEYASGSITIWMQSVPFRREPQNTTATMQPRLCNRDYTLAHYVGNKGSASDPARLATR